MGCRNKAKVRVLQKIYDRIGLVSEWSGRIVSGLIILLIVSITYEVVLRYLFGAPTTWSFSLSYMLGGTFAVIGLAYVYYHHANVRVDIIYTRFSPRGRLIIDIVFTFIFFFPLFFMLTWVFGRDALFSYSVHEIATESTWYPILWPFKTLLALGFGLVCLQGIVTFLKDVMTLAKGGKEPW